MSPGKGGRAAGWLAAICGAIFGLATARFLFETDPIRLSVFGAWPGVLLLAGAGLAGALSVTRYTRRLDTLAYPGAPWAPLALALPLIDLPQADVNLLRSCTLLLGALALLVLIVIAPAVQHPEQFRVHGAPRHWPISRLLSLSLFVFLFCIYLRTLAPAVGQADTFEFQVGVARLGIAHGSGYPLLMLIGRLFTWLPVGGTLAFRANLTSAFFGALASVAVERVTRRLGASPLVAVLTGLTFGVSPTLWSRAVEIEAYTLNAAFISGILYLALSFFDPFARPRRMVVPQLQITNYQLRFCLLAFVFGLSLTNHLTTLLLAPAVGAAVLLGTMVWRWAPGGGQSISMRSVLRLSPLVCVAFLLGVSVYIYLPVRWPAVNHGEALSLAGFINIVTGNEARGAFQWRLPFQDSGRYPIAWSKIAAEYGWLGLGLAVLGIIGLLRPPSMTAPGAGENQAAKPRRVPFDHFDGVIAQTGPLVTLALAYLGYLYFALAFNVPDPDFSAFFIPLHLITAVLVGLGVQWLVNQVANWWPREQPVFGVVMVMAFSLLPLASIWLTFPLVDHSGNWASQRAGELMLSQPLATHAAILADSEKIAPLAYLQIADGQRPDLDIIVLPDEASYRAALDERLAAGQVVYLGRYLSGLGAAYSLRSIGPLVEVSPAPFTSTGLAIQPTIAQLKMPVITLNGYATSGGDSTLAAASPGHLNFYLVWHAVTAPAANLLVNLRLVNLAGQTAWQSVGSVPVSGLYPTNAWRAGEIISDFYSLPIAPSLPPGRYQLQIALLPPFALAPDSVWSPVAPVAILGATEPPSPQHLLRAHIGNNWLIGYDLPEAVAPGSSYAVTLYWLRTNQSDTVPAPAAETISASATSIAAWQDGAVAPVVYPLTAPKSGAAIHLSINGDGPAICGWLAGPTQGCALPAIQLAGQAAAQGAINYDNQLLLTQALLETHTGAPGGSVTVNLEWQALRAISGDYTVFVHLLGPDGLVHGQIDRWPVSGTRATSSWVPGEIITDPYVIQVPADAPSGPYQVEVGLYLLSTGERLPVLSAGGVPVDDRLLLPGLEVQAH